MSCHAGENHCPENTRTRTKQGRHDGRSLDVAVQKIVELSSDETEQVLLLHDSATHDNHLRRQCTDPRSKPQRKIAGFERPPRVIERQLGRWPLPALLHGWTRGQPFKAIPVKWAPARIWV